MGQEQHVTAVHIADGAEAERAEIKNTDNGTCQLFKGHSASFCSFLGNSRLRHAQKRTQSARDGNSALQESRFLHDEPPFGEFSVANICSFIVAFPILFRNTKAGYAPTFVLAVPSLDGLGRIVIPKGFMAHCILWQEAVGHTGLSCVDLTARVGVHNRGSAVNCVNHGSQLQCAG